MYYATPAAGRRRARTKNAPLSRARARMGAPMYEGLTVTRPGLGLPFVPFTFPTVLFARLADDMGFEFSWPEVDEFYSAYVKGRSTGEISKPGNTSQAVDYIASQTWARKEKVREWMKVAEAGVFTWWGNTGTYLADFGAKTVSEKVGDGIKDAVKTVVGAASDVGKKIVAGAAEGLGVPKWIFVGVVGVSLVLVVYLGFKFRYPKVSFS